jgi:hypothetical protein
MPHPKGNETEAGQFHIRYPRGFVEQAGRFSGLYSRPGPNVDADMRRYTCHRLYSTKPAKASLYFQSSVQSVKVPGPEGTAVDQVEK